MPDRIDALFQTAVAAIDAGAIAALKRVLTSAPALVGERLHSPGPWLRDQVGDALDGFFRAPYLLWFVAEDPVRNGKLPPNIAELAHTIIETAMGARVAGFQEQLDYALRLVCWSSIAGRAGLRTGVPSTSGGR